MRVVEQEKRAVLGRIVLRTQRRESVGVRTPMGRLFLEVAPVHNPDLGSRFSKDIGLIPATIKNVYHGIW